MTGCRGDDILSGNDGNDRLLGGEAWVLLDSWWLTVTITAQAFALGWSAADLFGCDAVAPWHRPPDTKKGRAGLMLLL